MGTFDQFVAALDEDSLVSFEVPGSLRDDPECVYSVTATWFGDAVLVSARDITDMPIDEPLAFRGGRAGRLGSQRLPMPC